MEKDRNKKSNDENNYIMIEGASWKVNLESTTERYYIVMRKKVKDECRGNQVMLSPVMRSQDKNRQYIDTDTLGGDVPNILQGILRVYFLVEQ